MTPGCDGCDGCLEGVSVCGWPMGALLLRAWQDAMSLHNTPLTHADTWTEVAKEPRAGRDGR